MDGNHAYYGEKEVDERLWRDQQVNDAFRGELLLVFVREQDDQQCTSCNEGCCTKVILRQKLFPKEFRRNENVHDDGRRGVTCNESQVAPGQCKKMT